MQSSSTGAIKRGKGKENIPGHNIDDPHANHPIRHPIPRSEVTLPLEVHSLVDCRWKRGGNEYFQARIIERRPTPGGAADEWDYYVHYKGHNRRNDEWVTLDHLNLDTVIPPEPIDPNDPKSKKRRLEEEHSEEEGEGHEDFSADQLREHIEFTKVKNIESIEMGRYEMETWYYSPLPKQFMTPDVKKLFVSEFDLAFFKSREQMIRHVKKVRLLHPPGTEIYRHKGISMFEVDGKKARLYCQNLCYLAKLFLDHKSLTYDTDIFLFYIMCECDERGAHIVGYFSKEKVNDQNNLSCILTFPAYQRRGYGKFLISFSYELSKLEKRPGTPERPLSDLGYVSYRGYWTRVLLHILKEREDPISINELSDMTMILPKDIIATLGDLKMIQYIKGNHVICAAPHVIDAHLKKCGSAGLEVEPSKIIWAPFDRNRGV